MKKLMFVFGTRPETIKMAPLIHAFANSGAYKVQVCVSGQHRQMLDQFLKIFAINVDHDLNIMKPGQDLFDVTVNCLAGLKEVFSREVPDMIFVQGDTTTAFCGALAGFYLNIPVAHVEAGLRTHDMRAPFPEEANRVMLSRIATLHFAPTATSRDHLIAEQIHADQVFVTGNSVIDALYWMQAQLRSGKRTATILDPALATLFASDRRILLVTGHRRENFGEGFLNVCQAIRDIAEAQPDLGIVYPVHLNPNVQKPVHEILGNLPNVLLTGPVEYPEFVYMLDRSYLVLTDSGGVQEEAPSLGKPVLVTRDKTERPEAVEAGTVQLVGTDRKLIFTRVMDLLRDPGAYHKMAFAHNPYGDGSTAKQIFAIVDGYFQN